MPVNISLSFYYLYFYILLFLKNKNYFLSSSQYSIQNFIMFGKSHSNYGEIGFVWRICMQ